MLTLTLPLFLAVRSRTGKTLHRLHTGQRGEGVISAAIAVLVMAFLGAGMWIAFDTMFKGTTDRTTEQMEQIGASSE